MKMNLQKTIIATSLSLIFTNILCVTSAIANEKNDRLDTITVTAARGEKSVWDSSESVAVVSNDEIQDNNGNSLVETLRDIPGIDITDTSLAGRKQIMIRGEMASRVLILIDGQELAYQRGGHAGGAAISIDMESVERVEVIKGPYSVLYGSQALGGVVNFITKKGGGKNNQLHGHAKFIYDGATNGLTEMASAYGTINNIFDYRLSGTYSKQEERKTPEGKLENTDFNNNSLSSWMGLNLGKHKVGLSVDRHALSTQAYVSESQKKAMRATEFSMEFPTLTREKIGLFYDYKLDSRVLKNIHLDTYYQKQDRTLIDKMANARGAVNTTTSDIQDTQGVNLQIDLKPTDPIKLILGAQYLQDGFAQTVDSKTVMGTVTTSNSDKNNWKQQHASIFAQSDWSITDKFSWNIGLRQYWLTSELKSGEYSNSQDTPRSDSKNNLAVSTGTTYEISDNFIFRASFGQGYVYPTLPQLYSITYAHGSSYYGNPDLEAEKSNSYEVGFRFNNNKWLFDNAFYFSDAKNYIDTMSCSGEDVCKGATSPSKYYYNANKAKTYGWEFELDYLNWSISPYLKGNVLRRQVETASYTSFDSGMPTFTGIVGLKNSTSFNYFDLDSNLFMRGASIADKKNSTNTTHYDAWQTLNLSMNASFGDKRQYQIGLDFNNILNKNYQTATEGVPAAGFNAVIATSMQF